MSNSFPQNADNLKNNDLQAERKKKRRTHYIMAFFLWPLCDVFFRMFSMIVVVDFYYYYYWI